MRLAQSISGSPAQSCLTSQHKGMYLCMAWASSLHSSCASLSQSSYLSTSVQEGFAAWNHQCWAQLLPFPVLLLVSLIPELYPCSEELNALICLRNYYWAPGDFGQYFAQGGFILLAAAISMAASWDIVIESCSNSSDNISGVNSLLILLENPCQADIAY